MEQREERKEIFPCFLDSDQGQIYAENYTVFNREMWNLAYTKHGFDSSFLQSFNKIYTCLL